MTRKLVYALLFLNCCSVLIVAGQGESVNETYSSIHQKKNALNKERLQLSRNGNSISIWGFNFNKLPRSLRQFKLTDGGQKIAKSQIQEYAARSLDSIFNMIQDTSFRFDRKITRQEFERQKQSFLAGGPGGDYIKNQWIKLGEFSANEQNGFNNSIQSKGRFRKHQSFFLQPLPGGYAAKLPELENTLCVPIDLELIRLRKTEGYGIKNLKYQRQPRVTQEIVNKNFDLFFEANDTQPYQKGLKAVTDYLNENSYFIVRAEVGGGYSIEGQAQRNEELKQARARVLTNVLKSYSRAKMNKEIVSFQNPFEFFRQQIKNTSYEWMDSLSDKKIRDFINTNTVLKTELEPYLKVQRHAVLKLAMVKPITRDERISDIIVRLNKLTSNYFKSKMQEESEGKIVGMLEALLDYYKEDMVTFTELDSMISNTNGSQINSALLGYYLLSRYQKMVKAADGQKAWETEWNNYKYNFWISKGNRALIDLSLTESLRPHWAKLMKMLADYQSYSFAFINNGLMEANSLCDIYYPNNSRYWLLAINDYSFLYLKIKNEKTQVSCLTLPSTIYARSDTPIDMKKFVAVQDLAPPVLIYRKFGTRLYRSLSYDALPKNPMYLKMKKYLLQKNKLNQWFVKPISNEMPIFQLALFFETQLIRWNPEENYFYDKEIRLEEMNSMVGRLKKNSSRLCPDYIVDLYLEYHLKALHYLDAYAVPGNALHTRIADESIQYISNYYTRHAKLLPSEFVLYLVRQLNTFNWLPGNKPGAWYSYNLLKAVATTRILSTKEFELLLVLIKMYDPTIEQNYGQLIAIEQLKGALNK